MDSRHWSLAQMERYFSGEMPDGEGTGELLDHLADCPVCFKMAGEYANKMEKVHLSSEDVGQEIAAQSMAALRNAAESEGDSEIVERLRNWVSKGKAWGAVQLEVAKNAISSGYETVAGLVRADALRLVEAHAGTRGPVRNRGGVVRTRGAVMSLSGKPEPLAVGVPVEVEPVREGKGISINWSGFPGDAQPLIALLSLAEGKAHIRLLERDPAGGRWVVRFGEIPEGGYLLLVEETAPGTHHS